MGAREDMYEGAWSLLNKREYKCCSISARAHTLSLSLFLLFPFCLSLPRTNTLSVLHIAVVNAPTVKSAMAQIDIARIDTPSTRIANESISGRGKEREREREGEGERERKRERKREREREREREKRERERELCQVA